MDEKSTKARVYVAGSSAPDKIQRAVDLIAALSALGCEVYDWPAVIKGHGKGDEELPPDVLIGEAMADLKAAVDARIVIVLTYTPQEARAASPYLPTPKLLPASGGSLVEMGAVLGADLLAITARTERRSTLVVSGPERPHPLFGHLADHWHRADEGEADRQTVAWVSGWLSARGLAP